MLSALWVIASGFYTILTRKAFFCVIFSLFSCIQTLPEKESTQDGRNLLRKGKFFHLRTDPFFRKQADFDRVASPETEGFPLIGV